ncbi:hypothetical protein JQ628_22660 [Bradyrhizobium lablabi]|uniref:hypothetical protein n=1 Tax=Bradyrhizobium lablabi TaxID=722472 RepID=UPI001BAE429B|nr:hypothetical protein [Bradyrhizobium lablabi]MBR1124348.1 hypothetical protein [Bradyrhizobium lablabi]
MTDEKEIKQRRLAERKAYRLTLTADASKLMDVLKRRSPEIWQRYRKTVEEEGIIEDEPFSTILRTAFSLFPERKTHEITDLLRRMLDMVRAELGMKDRGT